jgi:hypothetical protein
MDTLVLILVNYDIDSHCEIGHSNQIKSLCLAYGPIKASLPYHKWDFDGYIVEYEDSKSATDALNNIVLLKQCCNRITSCRPLDRHIQFYHSKV